MTQKMTNNKHAFLILAHGEFPVLEHLVSCLDDQRNDIYIHFDLKTQRLPSLHVSKARLLVLTDRVNVHWGDVSIINAEYKLFEAAAANGAYSYYHLLSGVDLPLKSQDELHDFFNKHQGREFIGFAKGDIQAEIDRKVRRFHLYQKHFRAGKGWIAAAQRIVRAGFIRIQNLLAIERHRRVDFRKGPQWVSITDAFVRYVLSQKQQVLKTYEKTFCSDEIFIQTLCWNSEFRERLFSTADENYGSQRIIGWKDGQLLDWTDADYDHLIASDITFARKFSSRNSGMLDKILNHVNSGNRPKIIEMNKTASQHMPTHNTKNKTKVSIIVPVYNAQATLERTLVSLKEQTYTNIEFVFIDDASTDASLLLLEQFAISVIKHVGFTTKIITLRQNNGVAYARNKGLDHATGDFIMYVDADDTLVANAVESCVQWANKKHADIVYFHWWLSFSNTERQMNQPFCTSGLEAIKSMLVGKMRWNLWLFMVRRSLYVDNNIRFTPGANMGEDLTVTTKLLVQARQITLLDKPLYRYRQDNSDSVSKSYSEKHIREIETNILETERYLQQSKYAQELGQGIDFLKLNIKLPLLVTGTKKDYKQWTKWFTSSNRFILANRHVPLRTRAIQWMAWKRQYWAVWLYNVLVFRVIYGIIYK